MLKLFEVMDSRISRIASPLIFQMYGIINLTLPALQTTSLEK